MMEKAWICQVVEFEAGWGSRPDGMILARTVGEGKALDRPDGHLCGDEREYSTTVGEWREVELTEKGQTALTHKPAVWVHNNVNDYFKVRL